MKGSHHWHVSNITSNNTWALHHRVTHNSLSWQMRHSLHVPGTIALSCCSRPPSISVMRVCIAPYTSCTLHSTVSGTADSALQQLLPAQLRAVQPQCSSTHSSAAMGLYTVSKAHLQLRAGTSAAQIRTQASSLQLCTVVTGRSIACTQPLLHAAAPPEVPRSGTGLRCRSLLRRAAPAPI